MAGVCLMPLPAETSHTATVETSPSLIPRTNRLGVEQRGIEYIPDGERRGTARQVGLMWSGAGLRGARPGPDGVRLGRAARRDRWRSTRPAAAATVA